MKEPNFQFKMHLNLGKTHALMHRDDKLRVQTEVHTTNGKSKRYWFIDNDSREFTDYNEFLEALREYENVVPIMQCYRYK